MADVNEAEVEGPPPQAERPSPSHIPYSVRRGTDGRSYWTPIGVGFAHKAGDGVNVALNCFPIDGRIVIRERKHDAADGAAPAEPATTPEDKDVAPSTSPTHVVYHVTKGRDDQSYWRSIGTGFANADGKGWNIRVTLLPVDGALVVLERKAKPDSAAAATASVPQEAAIPA